MDQWSELHLSLSDISLAVCTVLATYVGYQCFKTPRHVSSTAKETSKSGSDSLRHLRMIDILHGYRHFVLLSGLARLALTITRPKTSSALCPSPASLSPELFAWSGYNIAAISLIFAGGITRILCYRTLGNNYTFEIQKPQRLIKEGIYHYIQHPGYSSGLTCVFGVIMFFGRFDGGLGCFLPPRLALAGSVANVAMITLIMVGMFTWRVTEEERVLKDTFGEEWVQWSTRTKRFIPFVV